MVRKDQRSDRHNVVALVDRLLERGLAGRATDLHFEPTDTDMVVRVRVDGQLLDFDRIPAELAENVVTRLKVLAGLLTYRIDIPQEGGLRWDPKECTESNGAVDLRVATFPTIRGERVVVRVFAPEAELQTLEQLGLAVDQLEELRRAAAEPDGLIVTTGPAGSGKTTTLASLIRHLQQGAHGASSTSPEPSGTPVCRRSIITLEDPVEQRIDGVTQIQINPHGELSYERCLRSLLRQDPQVLLVGEVRDDRTANIVIEAALTGHLILTTVHSADSAEAVVRFLEMGIAPYQLVSALTLICAQRLLRRKCHACGSPARTDCPACLGVGYAGRVAVAELARIDESARRLILEQPSASRLRGHFHERGRGLRQRAQDLVSQGVTDTAEIDRALGMGVD